MVARPPRKSSHPAWTDRVPAARVFGGTPALQVVLDDQALTNRPLTDRGHLNDGLPVLPNFTGLGYLAGSMPSLRLPVEALPRLPLPSLSGP